MTAASGADTFGPAGGFGNVGRLSNSANAPASGADQPTLRDQLEDWLWRRESVQLDLPDEPGHRAAFLAAARLDTDPLMELIEADRERAKAEAAADAYETAATACRAIGVPHQANVFASYAAALRGSAGGGTT